MNGDDDDLSYEVDPELAVLLARANEMLARLEPWLPPKPPRIDWRNTLACRWRRSHWGGWLEPVTTLNCPDWNALKCVERQKKELDRNTRQFLKNLPANNALLTGSRGCGKSSLVKSLLLRHAKKGLRLVEVDKGDLIHLEDMAARLAEQPWHFILFSDDLSFEPGDPGYKSLKAALDGSVAGLPANMLIYATSNRRHLMPEYFAENSETRYVEGEVHLGESIEEKVSLSDRFGLWLSFYPFSQDDYLEIVLGWVESLGGTYSDAARLEALQWATQRGGRSGRIARQFAQDWVGRQKLGR